MQTLAVKYRPKAFDDVIEQESVKIILQQQLQAGEVKHAYLFCGGAGTGKTTCARIFANDINGGEGSPIELDAARNSSVDDVRNIIQQAKTKSLDSEYKVFIIDECHAISNTGWQAFLKLIEEPPAKSIFIFCTTDPQKIPKTILSRVQRYDFRRISQQGIVCRLEHIIYEENINVPFREGGIYQVSVEALEYIAKLAEGSMRTAISLMDKCLSYNSELTMKNVVKALGVANYDNMIEITSAYIFGEPDKLIKSLEDIHSSGVDMKQFIRQYLNFVLDIKKWFILGDFEYLQIPQIDTIEEFIKDIDELDDTWDNISKLLDTIIKVNAEIKYDSNPKYLIEAMLLEGMK